MRLFQRIINLLGRLVIGLLARVTLVATHFFRNEGDNPQSPVFIIGAPRTGSTILYQALTNAYNVAYIDNTACAWHQNLRFGMWLSHKKYGNTPHNNFNADHGNTSEFGGHAPSECGGFWYRWLPKDRHFVDHQDITAKMLKGIRAEVLGVSAFHNKPILFKNLNAGQRLRLIKQAFPDAKIIFIRRDPRFVIRSILKARRKAGVREGDWWSIMPPNVGELKSLPEHKMCAAQVYFLEKQIEEDLALFPSENVKEIHLSELSANLAQTLAGWMEVANRPGGMLPEFKQDSVDSLDRDELRELNLIAAQYPFKKDLFV